MPTYDMRCKTCGFEDEMFLFLHEYEAGVCCPDCDSQMAQRIGVVATIGAMPSKPITVGGADISFTSNGSLRQWQNENPDVRMLSTDSMDWKNQRYQIRERAERQAKKMGWRDFDQKTGAELDAQKYQRPKPKAPIVSEA